MPNPLVNLRIVYNRPSAVSAAVPANAIQLRDASFVFDRAGDYITNNSQS